MPEEYHIRKGYRKAHESLSIEAEQSAAGVKPTAGGRSWQNVGSRRRRALDQRGRRIAVGDWVRLIAFPPDLVRAVPQETQDVFRKALGKTFRIEGFGRYGHAELDLTRKVARLNTIWVEPAFLVRFRRRARS